MGRKVTLSFIDKALERAKTLQQKQEGAASPGVQQISQPQAKLPVMGSLGFVGHKREICYSITRTVAVDHDTMSRHKLIVKGEHPTVEEEYKHLRTHILHGTKPENRNTLMFTGPRPGEGKTLTSINLALSISQEVDQTVLLVDADLRNPSVHRYFGFVPELGLVDYLKNGVPIPELLVHPEGLAKLVLLPGGKPTREAAELIKSPQMAELVSELKDCYPDRYVLFDLPPLLNFADALAFAPLVDGIVIVVEAGKTPREEIDRCLEMMKKFAVMGLVLNKTDIPDQSHYYDYNQNLLPAATQKKFPWFRHGKS